MTDLTTIERRVKRHVANCPSLIIRAALSDAAREFFGRSRCWTETFEVELSPGQQSYVMHLGDKMTWVGINWVSIDGVPLDPAVMADAPLLTGQGRPRWYSGVDARILSVYPTPNTAGTMTVNVFVKNALGETEFPPALLGQYADALAEGTIAGLLTMNGYDWYDPKAQAVHLNAFTAGIQQARFDFKSGFSRAPTAVRMRPIA